MKRRTLRRAGPAVTVLMSLIVTPSVHAAPEVPVAEPMTLATAPARDLWRVDWVAADGDTTSARAGGSRTLSSQFADAAMEASGGDQVRHAAAVEHSEAYETRARIHKLASFAYLPLVATEGALGASIYSNDTPGKRSAHQAVAAGVMGLFAVNTVTGVWNLLESRHDPNGRTRRMVHGLLMLAADIGFLDTLATAPGGRNNTVNFQNDKDTHRNVAVASIGLASASYLMMLVGGR